MDLSETFAVPAATDVIFISLHGPELENHVVTVTLKTHKEN